VWREDQAEGRVSIKTEISERQYKQDKWLGIKCTGNSEEHYTETETTVCDVCGEKRVFITEVIELLHAPSTIRNVKYRTGPCIDKYEWGFKKNKFYACDNHTEIELDKCVAKLKIRGRRGNDEPGD
jgi:hypothetical protein